MASSDLSGISGEKAAALLNARISAGMGIDETPSTDSTCAAYNDVSPFEEREPQKVRAQAPRLGSRPPCARRARPRRAVALFPRLCTRTARLAARRFQR